ncbi:MAG TPA: hypothetical protein VF800_10225 [Telluria sp.]|jgi:hypothetical protein
MKKFAPLLLLFLFIMVAWEAMAGSSGMSIDIDGEHLDGPLGTLFGMLFAGGGLLIAALVMLFVGLLLAVLFAGLGVLAVGALVLAALLVGVLVSPLLLPLAIVAAIAWYLARGERKQRAGHDALKP